MNHLIFSAVLTACLRIGGHQHTHQHGPYNEPPHEYFYKEPAQLNSSEMYSWPTLVSPCPTQHVAIYTFVFYVLTYFASNFRRFNLHAKVFRGMMMVYPFVTALTGFQVANLEPYLAKILPHFLGLYKKPMDLYQLLIDLGSSPLYSELDWFCLAPQLLKLLYRYLDDERCNWSLTYFL
ncbi:hypothetical protein DSO57_1017549 [Entomophthora muscae]|uniref:Uncharacterized protein n=1 Tax=Entomophthora muscae TaxID=34485 RepID=A0ACC2STA5_9FUNG|nr:hypothetical protein DSO57_1017549 [Entomophthora muscae]